MFRAMIGESDRRSWSSVALAVLVAAALFAGCNDDDGIGPVRAQLDIQCQVDGRDHEWETPAATLWMSGVDPSFIFVLDDVASTDYVSIFGDTTALPGPFGIGVVDSWTYSLATIRNTDFGSINGTATISGDYTDGSRVDGSFEINFANLYGNTAWIKVDFEDVRVYVGEPGLLD